MDENKHLTPVWIVYVDGGRLDTKYDGALQQIVINDTLNGISSFSLLFDTAEVKLQEKCPFSIGSEVSIHMGYKDDIEEVFKGEVHKFNCKFPEKGVEQFEITGSSVLQRLEHGKRYRSYENKTPDEIIKGILESYSLKADVEEMNVSHEFESEKNISDYKYVLENAKLHGKQVYADGTTVYIKDEVTIHDDEIIYELGKSLKSFDASQDVSKLFCGVEYIGWDSLKNESFAGNASFDDIPVKIGGDKNWSDVIKGNGGKYVETRLDMSCKDTDEAKKLAAGLLQNDSYKFGYGHGTAEGEYKLRPGMRVLIKAVGEIFEGEYMAEVVTHCLSRQSGYSSEFILKRNMTA